MKRKSEASETIREKVRRGTIQSFSREEEEEEEGTINLSSLSTSNDHGERSSQATTGQSSNTTRNEMPRATGQSSNTSTREEASQQVSTSNDHIERSFSLSSVSSSTSLHSNRNNSNNSVRSQSINGSILVFIPNEVGKLFTNYSLTCETRHLSFRYQFIFPCIILFSIMNLKTNDKGTKCTKQDFGNKCEWKSRHSVQALHCCFYRDSASTKPTNTPVGGTSNPISKQTKID